MKLRSRLKTKTLKQIKDEELKNVTGGSTTEDAPNEVICGNWAFSGFVIKYAESHVGEKLYLVSHDKDEYYYGIDACEGINKFYDISIQEMK